MAYGFEKRALQGAVLFFCLVPLLAGGFGVLSGLRFAGGLATIDADSHFRYLSGLLLGIGLGYVSCVRHIEVRTVRFRLLTAIVVLGGLGRLFGLVMEGAPEGPMLFGLGMELIVTPMLCLWQARVARLS